MDPALIERLEAWGLRPDPASPHAPPESKNQTLMTCDPAGRRVLVKISPGGISRGVFREGAILERLATVPHLQPYLPALRAFDPDRGIVALEWIEGARTLHDLHYAGALTVEAAGAIAQAVARLHSATDGLADRLGVDDGFATYGDLAPFLVRPTLEFYARQPRAVLELLERLHQDAAALAAMTALVDSSGSCLLHGDLKPANILLRPSGEPVLIDWELASWGDPARDLGALWSEWLSLGAGAFVSLLDAYRGCRSADRPAAPDLDRQAARWAGVGWLLSAYGICHRERRFEGDARALAERGCQVLASPEQIAAS